MTESAVVTGAGSGIGKEAAQRLASAGFRLALCGRRESQLQETRDMLQGSGHSVHPGDLADVSEVMEISRQVVDQHSEVSAVVLCAGGQIRRTDKTLEGLKGELNAAFDSHVLTAGLLTEALLPAIVNGRGRIVAIGSIVALRGGSIGYSAAKSALHGWAFALARDVGPRGITVNVVAPGYVADTEFFGVGLAEDRRQALMQETMNGRVGTPADVVALIAYLVSPESGHLTAQVIQVNGGALPR